MGKFKDFVKSWLMPSGFTKKTVSPPGQLMGDTVFWKSLRQLASNADELVYPYAQSIWVYASIRTIAENIATTPFSLYSESRRKSGGANKLVESGQLYELLLRPNPIQSLHHILEGTMTYLGLYGEAFWIVERPNITSIPKEIWLIDPTQMNPLFDDRKMLVGWTYSGNSQAVFGVHEVLQFKYFNPYNPMRGLSPLSAASMGIEQDYYASSYNKNFFQNGAAIGGFIEVEEELGDSAYNRLLDTFNSRYQGTSKAHNIGLLEGGAKFKEAKLSQKDMDFVVGKKITREEIFGAFKTNSVVLGLYEDVKSYEGISVAHSAFWHECLIPKINYIEELLWVNFFSKINGGEVWAEFDLANVESLFDDFDRKTVTANRLFQMGYPLNIINKRLEMGMPDVQWGSTGFCPTNMQPITPAFLKGETTGAPPVSPADAPPKPDKNPPAGDKPAKKPTKDATDTLIEMVEMMIEKSVSPEAMKARYLEVFVPAEKQFEKKLHRFFFEQRKRVLERIYSADTITIDTVFDKKEEIQQLRKLFELPYHNAIKAGAFMIQEELNLVDFEYNPLDKGYHGYATLRMLKIPNEIVNTIRNKLRNTISQEHNGNKEELAKKIRTDYNSLSSRTSLIAKTEAAAVINAGRFVAMQHARIRKHFWMSLNGDTTRSSHQLLHGQVANLGENFINAEGLITNLRFPGDLYAKAKEVVACSCITVPIKE